MPKKKLVWIFSVTAIFLAIAACNFTPATQAPAFPTENPYLEVQRVPLEDAKAAFDDNSAIFVDVRDAELYADSHIPGALPIPLDDLESRMGELDPDQWIITYCT